VSPSRDVGEVLRSVVQHLPGGGEVRDGQRTMAEAVLRALADEKHLVVRAGTGTGKSLGYAVPAVLSGKRVVVATATKALQDQLASKDLPLIAAALPQGFSFAVLKGRSNYVCMQRVRESEDAGEQGRLGEAEMTESAGVLGEQARAVLEWAETTTTGDRAELEVEPDPKVWSSLSVTSEECPGAFRCPSGSDCFAEAARARAAAADVVVVNLHLLGADLASGGAVLPEYDALVIDEAHELEDVLTSSLGVRITSGRLRVVALGARAALGTGGRSRGREGAPTDPAAELLDAAEQFERALTARAGERLRPGIGGELGEVVELLASRLERLGSDLQRAVEAGRDAASGSAAGEAAQQLTRSALAVGHLREELAKLAALDEDQVAWVEGGPRPALELAPIDVAPILAELVFSKRPVVLTSATIPPGLAARLGAEPQRTDEIDVGSPFAYEQNALLYCAAHLPDRRKPEAEPAIVEEIASLITAAGGRTLALFTSRAAMERVAEAVRTRVEHPVIVQGERSKAALIESFTSQPEACLFATMGFWQGVDVPGATLSLVVIDRIPFARPDDPLAAARRDRAGPAAFRTIDLPRAASLLAQGAGRLVRTVNDRGVVAVLDSRLATGSYRWDLVRALPPMRRTKVRAEAEEFLRAIHADARLLEQVQPAEAASRVGRKERTARSARARAASASDS
jgi:ATP-dependent DNA helicase DinG